MLTIVFNEQNFLEKHLADSVTGCIGKKYVYWSIFIHLSSFGGWPLNATVSMLGRSVLLLRGEDSHRGHHTWAGTPRNWSRFSSRPCQFLLQPRAWAPGVCTDGLSLGKEAAPFHPTHMAKQRKQNSIEFPSSCLYIYPQRQSKYDEFLLFLNDLTLAK